MLCAPPTQRVSAPTCAESLRHTSRARRGCHDATVPRLELHVAGDITPPVRCGAGHAELTVASGAKGRHVRHPLRGRCAVPPVGCSAKEEARARHNQRPPAHVHAGTLARLVARVQPFGESPRAIWRLCHAGAVLLRFAVLLSTGLPLTGSAPLPTVAPSAEPTPIPVEIVGDDSLTIIGLIVSAGAAIVGLIAALAARKAANAARDAAETGEKAAQHAATAAAAAAQTAEYERSTFNLSVLRARMAQARQIEVSWESADLNPAEPSVTLRLENHSQSAVRDVVVWGLFEKEQVTDLRALPILRAGERPAVRVRLTGKLPDSYLIRHQVGVIQFTDAEGVHWERWTSTAPVEIER